MVYSFKYKASISFLLVLCLFALTGLGCKPSPNGGNLDSGIALTIWGLWQNGSDFEPLLTTFKEQTGVTVEYRKIASVAEYEKMLLTAMAQDRGPDIFVVHHNWIDTKKTLISPAPPNIIDEKALRDEFVEVVADDLLRDGQIYALPVSVDTLALYYNKDILSNAGIARPPQTWDEFQQIAERITKVSRVGTIEQSAAAIGTAANVSRAADILQLLFMQSGMEITPPNSTDVSISTAEGNRSLTFYTDFANKSKKVYTWDLQQDYSLDAFAEGETAMMFNYSYHYPTIQAKNPRLRFGIAPVPQIADSKTINFASYWPYTVSTKSPAKDAAWTFLRFLSESGNSQTLNESQHSPPARREDIAAYSRNPVFGVFAEQALTAVSWKRTDIVAIDAILSHMIDDVVTGAATVSASLSRAQDQINQVQQKSLAPPPPAAEPESTKFKVL